MNDINVNDMNDINVNDVNDIDDIVVPPSPANLCCVCLHMNPDPYGTDHVASAGGAAE